MKLIPLTATPIAGRHKDHDPMMIVNMDLVYCISKTIYWPDASKDGVEGSKLHLALPSGYTLEVTETRTQIMSLLEGPCKQPCQCKK